MVNLKDWQEINIGNDTTLKARIGWQGLTTSEYKDSGEYYLVTGTDFENGLVNWDTCHFVDKWRFDQDKNIQLKVNDVLITKDGTIGKAGFIDTIKLPTTLNSGVFVIRTNSNKLDQKYLYYIFTSEIFVEFLNRLTAGSTINHLYQKDFIHFTFKAPNIEEQKAIAKALSDTDELINSLEKLISKKEAIKQGSMQQILTGKKRLSGFTGEWEEKKLADICEIKKGEQLNKQYLNYTDPFPVINGGIEPSGYTNKYNSEPNTITISEGGNSCGFVNFISTNFWLGGHCYSINNFNLEITFFYQLLKNFENKIMGLRLGSGLPNIQKKALLDFRINIPKKIDEQQAIAQILSDMDKEIESLKSKLSKTKAIKDGIMSELLTGKTRLKVKDE
ncbi:restriction endonuclease subunit S [Aliarcobacter cryaerophilus]|uniref:restriction endonuclease subunit S n=1 Tax=Aliarcobacter TaxID=2321111 RepID=UPI0021B5CE80|nr:MULTISPECIES: restriction endonuclease subunit S [Aliarcobacter]MCT7545259.1 restriction endonuclease subunit S [Aliarcobacter cryaerophilus]MDX4064115.1 restriction endonuclease subunit S [Aliarcobacter skirrowii]